MAPQHNTASRLSGKRRFSMSCFYPCHGSIVLIRTRKLPYHTPLIRNVCNDTPSKYNCFFIFYNNRCGAILMRADSDRSGNGG